VVELPATRFIHQLCNNIKPGIEPGFVFLVDKSRTWARNISLS